MFDRTDPTMPGSRLTFGFFLALALLLLLLGHKSMVLVRVEYSCSTVPGVLFSFLGVTTLGDEDSGCVLLLSTS